MKVYTQIEMGRLCEAWINGDAEIIYAREDANGKIYCTFKYRKRFLVNGKELPRQEREPS